MTQVLLAETPMGWQAWFTLGVLALMLLLLASDRIRPVVVIPACLLVLAAAGVVSLKLAFAGFSNDAVLTIGALYVVVAGIHRTRALAFLDRALFSSSTRMDVVLVRLGATTAAMSAMMNNTPLVAMLIPRVQGWAAQRDIPVSKLLMPISFATVLGGTITIMGTSTNLLVAGWMETSGLTPINTSSLATVGIPATLVGVAYLATIGHRLLPERTSAPLVPDEESQDDRSGRAPLALLILCSMVLASATGLLPIMGAAIAAAIAMVATGCITESEILKVVDVSVLIVLAAALGIGQAIQQTGLAEAGAHVVVGMTYGLGPVAVIAAIYLATNLLTELISNNAAALLMLPTGIATATQVGIAPEAFAVTVAIAASAGFMTPIGYQTHLMVITPGGYRFSDFFRVGWLLNLIVMAVCVTTVLLVWC